MKNYKVGFLLGKFLPVSRGHLHLIDTASAQCEKLYVLMCSLKREPIEGILRYQWLKEIYNHRHWIEIIHVQDENPQYPEEADNFWDIWLTTFKNHLPEKPDVVFSSEDYGIEIARLMGIDHHMVDKERQIVPISATKIRNNPFENWDFITTNVQQHFMKKIVFLGTESAGKTTMCKRLANHFSTDWVEEYGRIYTESICPPNLLSIQDFVRIAEGQKKLVEEKNNLGHKIVFYDTEAIITDVFAKLFCPNDYETLFTSYYFDSIIKQQKYDLYILMGNDCPFVHDGNRQFESQRTEHYQLIKDKLLYYNLPFVEIWGESFDHKFNSIIKLLGDKFPTLCT